MIFDLTKNYVPEPYTESGDYRVFLRMLSVLLSAFKGNIDSIPELYSADECPDSLLPLLGSIVGYTYNESLSVSNNRIIIKYYPELLRYRGSKNGIRLAVALSLNTSDSDNTKYSTSSLIISYNKEFDTIRIYSPNQELINLDLIEVVRPVGMNIELIKSSYSETADELELKASVKVTSVPSDLDVSSVDMSQVGFSNNDTNKSDIEDQ